MQLNSDTGSSSAGGLRERPKWRREEHGRFMQALELYGSRQTGDEWKHITEFVGSRTMTEVRLHGRQYLQRLVRHLPLTPMATPLNGYLSNAGSQNGLNKSNYQERTHCVESQQRIRGAKGKRGVYQQGASVGGGSALNAAALDCALSMNVLAPVQFRSQPLQPLQVQNRSVIAAPQLSGRRLKAWTFQEEKAFETALAGWAGSNSYPWTKIAAIVPGRTAKEVRSRFNEMVDEIASIEAGEIPVIGRSTLSSVPSGSEAVRQQRCSSLSQRTVPPPPIEVVRRSVDKDGAVSVFSSGTSTRSSRGIASGIAMLSPTFLDMLANEAESEEKSPLSALPSSGLRSLPSPLFSPSVLLAKGLRGQNLSNTEACDTVKMEKMTTDQSTTATESKGLRRSSTPRIMNDFLAGDFKFDDSCGTTPIYRRKSPRIKPLTKFGQESSITKTDSGAHKIDVEVADATAA